MLPQSCRPLSSLRSMSARPRCALSVTDAARRRLLGPVEFAMTASGSGRRGERVGAVLPASGAGEGGDRGGWSLPPAAAGAVGVAGRVGGAGAEPRPCHRAAPGAGPAPGEDRRDRPGGDHRAGAGRAQGTPVGDREQLIGELAAWATHRIAAGRDPDRDQEPAARSARPRLPRVDLGVAGCVGHQGRSAGRRASSPTRPGWPRWV